MRVLLVVLAAGVLLAGCFTARPAPPDGYADLRAALTRTHDRSYTYDTRADLGDRTVRATGTVDPAQGRLRGTEVVTAGGREYVVQRAIGDGARPGPARLLPSRPPFDAGDPNGLAAFARGVRTAQRTAPHAFTGDLDPAGRFLPVGAPSLTLAGGRATYSVTVDDRGLVTAIDVTVTRPAAYRMTTTITP